jgi:hypothetical protein
MAEAVRLRNSNHGELIGIAIAILVFIPLGLWIVHHPLFFHATYEHQRIIFTIVQVISIVLLSVIIIRNRQLKLRLKGLLDAFDPGSAVVDDKSIVGSFQGHPASVTVTSGHPLRNEVCVCIGGRFSLPFKVQTFRSFRSVRTHMIAEGAVLLLIMSADIVYIPDHGSADVVACIPFWNSLILGIWACWLAALFFGLRRSYEPAVTQVDMQQAGACLTPLETRLPDRFRAALEKQKFRETLARIFDSCHADGVKAPIDGSDAVGAFWCSTESALKQQALNKETVRETLTALSTLYADVEQLRTDTSLAREPFSPVTVVARVGHTLKLEQSSRWFTRVNSKERSALCKIGLFVTGFGAVVALMVPSSFGLIAAIGLAIVLISFAPVIPKSPPHPQLGIGWALLFVVPFLMNSMLFLGYHFPPKVGRYVGVAILISSVVLWFWRPAPRSQNPTH